MKHARIARKAIQGGDIYIKDNMENRNVGTSPATISPFFQGQTLWKKFSTLPVQIVENYVSYATDPVRYVDWFKNG